MGRKPPSKGKDVKRARKTETTMKTKKNPKPPQPGKKIFIGPDATDEDIENAVRELLKGDKTCKDDLPPRGSKKKKSKP